MKLHYQKYPEEPGSYYSERRAPVVIIPGLFGSTSNWRSVARDLGNDRDVYVVDQRNHGQSPHAKSQRYEDMASDLLEFLDHIVSERVVLCGHSMGGKTAMAFSLLYPDRVSKLIVLDIAPVRYQHSPAPFLEKLLKINLTKVKSRREADKILTKVIPDTPTRLFLLQNLTGSSETYRWRINLPVLYEFMDEIAGFPEAIAKRSCLIESVFIAGERSDYVLPEYHLVIQKMFKQASFEEIPDAGHWIHADQPKPLLLAMREFLRK